MTKFTATDTKAIHRIDADLVPGKVVVFNGPNGGGKSTALDCLRTAVSGKHHGELEPRDGTRAGLVEFDGVTVKIGKRISFGGKSAHSVVLIEGGEDVRDFIDPGVKDKVIADERRLEKLCSIVDAKISDEQLKEFIGVDMWDDFITSRKEMKGSGIVATVKFMKRWLESQARDFEAKVEQCTGAIEEIGPVPTSKEKMPDVDALQSAMHEAIRQLDDANSRRKANLDAAEQLQAFGSTMPKLGELQDQLAEELNSQSEITQQRDELQEQIDELTKRLSEKKSSLLLADQTVKSIEKRIDDAEKQAVKLTELKAAVKNAVTEETIEALSVAQQQASQASVEGVIAKERLETAAANRTRLAELKSQREKVEASAATCRNLANESQTLFRSVLKGLDGWSISNDMRLCCKSDRSEQEAYDDLSPGLKAIRALELSLRKPTTTGADKIVICPQEVYESLDGKNKDILIGWAAEQNVCVATGECQQTDTCDACGYVQTMGKTHCNACGEEIVNNGLTVKTLEGSQA